MKEDTPDSGCTDLEDAYRDVYHLYTELSPLPSALSINFHLTQIPRHPSMPPDSHPSDLWVVCWKACPAYPELHL
jgi:hypothetical protein